MVKSLPILAESEDRAAERCERGVGTLATARGNLPLRRLSVQARLEGLAATTTVRQTFVNPAIPGDIAGDALEATYIFPLPDRAAVTRFELRVGQRLIEGTLRERAAARQEYDLAIQAGHRAAIAEEDRADVFTVRVGNILPGEEAEVSLELTGPVACDDGEGTFQFPLVVAPRYIPGAPLPGMSVGDGTSPDTNAVPDASRITPPVLLPGFPNPVELQLSVEIDPAGLPLSDFRSTLHAVVEESSEGVRKILIHPGERVNRDFILRFRVGESAVHTSLQVFPDAATDKTEQAGTYQLCILPPTNLMKAQRPRDVVFLLDRSGSMSGWKIVTARRALARMIDTLGEADRFTVLAFDHRLVRPTGFSNGSLVPATDRRRFEAIEFLAKLEADGGTEISAALEEGIASLTDSGRHSRDPILVLLTDGQVGNEDQVLKKFGAGLSGLRVFSLGIDKAVNAGFLKKLAQLGGGYTEVVESEDRLDAVFARIHRRIATPVVLNVAVQLDGSLEAETQTPRRIPDLFAGSPMIIRGRYRGAPPTTATIVGSDSVGRNWNSQISAVSNRSIAAGRLWARDQIRDLEDQYAIGGCNTASLSKRIVETSLQFGVLSRFTAFVAVDRSEVVNPGGEVHKILQPVELPADWEVVSGGVVTAGSMRFRKAPPETLSAFCLAEPSEVATAAAPKRASKRSVPGAGLVANALRSFGVRSGGGNTGNARVRKAAPVVLNLSAYRHRASQILDEIKRIVSQSGSLDAMTRLLPLLEALIDDLASVEAPNEVRQPLEELHKELRDMFAQCREQTESATLWPRAISILQAFAEAKEPAATSRAAFWK